MTNIFSKRFLRTVAVKLLPEAIKGPIRNKLVGINENRQNNEFEIEFIDNGAVSKALIRVTDSGETISFSIHNENKSGTEYLFLGTDETMEEMKGFLDIARSKNILFDAGANIGLFSLSFCALGPQKKAVAFEPSPQAGQVLEKHINWSNFQDRLILQKTAISNTSGTISFSNESSGYVQILASNLSTGSISVPVSTIDLECEKLQLYPDLLKIDVEGCELEALQGAEKLLRSKKPVIFLEVHLNYLESLNVNPKSICDFLSELNYSFFSCTGKPMQASEIYDSIKPVVRLMAK